MLEEFSHQWNILMKFIHPERSPVFDLFFPATMVINAQTSHMNALYIQCCQDRFTNLIIQVISCEKQRAVLNSLSTVLSLPSRTINTAAIGTHIAKVRPANLKTPARLKQPWLIFIAWMGFREHSSSSDQNTVAMSSVRCTVLYIAHAEWPASLRNLCFCKAALSFCFGQNMSLLQLGTLPAASNSEPGWKSSLYSESSIQQPNVPQRPGQVPSLTPHCD